MNSSNCQTVSGNLRCRTTVECCQLLISEEELAEKKIADEKREKSRAANRKYMSGYRKRIKEMNEAELLEPKNISAEMKGEWL